jgi:hypothetical protein
VRFLTYAGLEVPKKLRPSLEKVKEAIERDDLRSADVKKLTGHPFYRARLDYDSRLLLEFASFGGQRACLALEVIEKHAYDRSRFLRGAHVDEARVVDLTDAATEEVANTARPVRYLHPAHAEFHVLDKPISFDDRQSELYRLPLPLVLVGCAGSGKTALTLTKLRELPGDVLYVTQSPFLAESAAALYFSHGFESDSQSVDFLSYRKLLESIQVPRGRAVTLKDFRGFFERHRTAFRGTQAHQLFEELRGVISAVPGAPLSEEAYLALGVRQSIYPVAERRAVHQLFAKYRAWLPEAGLYDPNLLAHEYVKSVTPRYDAVVVDEIQDLTNAELSLVLAMLKNPRGFMLCGDANQIVHPNFFSWSKVKSLFYSHETEAVAAPIHILSANYRSSRTVCQLANALLKVKNARFGSVDRESTALVQPVAEAEGRVAGLVKKDSVVRELDKRLRGSARVAVIVLTEEKKAEAKQRFGTPLVFSVHEAKGLEYEAVVLYDIVSTERAAYAELADGVSHADVDKDELSFARAKDKSDKALEAYKFFVNALYVALTRAVDTVYIVESDIAHPLFPLLRVTFSEDASQFNAKASTLEDWQKEARRLELQGKQEQADAIRSTILRATPVPWTVLHDKGFEEVHQKVFAPGSVFTKAKQQLFDFGAFHDLGVLTVSVELKAGFRSPRSYAETRTAMRDRLLAMYRDKDPGKVWADVARYGLEHRNMMSLTPLMLAAHVGNPGLAEALIERGARVDAVDVMGRMPLHFALRSAFHDAAFAQEKLGALYELLCPTGLDIEASGRLLRLARSQAEFFVLAVMLARFHETYDGARRRVSGFTASMLDDSALAPFPRSVVPEARRRRVYWNGVLARAEIDSTYVPARRLWRRERTGHYVPSESARLRTLDAEGREVFTSLRDLLRVPLLDAHGR